MSKRARATPEHVYVVVIEQFVDDYHARAESNVREIAAYSNKSDAQDCVREYIDAMFDEDDAARGEEDPPIERPAFDALSFDEFEKAVLPYLCGEYVHRRVYWTFADCPIDAL